MNKSIVSSKKGASSIMVILILVVLVVFGVAALTTALSNMRLGQKVAGWNTLYYAAEEIANERYALIDQAVFKAYSQSGGNIEEAITRNIQGLDFDTVIENDGLNMEISYETWSDEIGISTLLALTISDPSSLYPVQWKEIQSTEARK